MMMQSSMLQAVEGLRHAFFTVEGGVSTGLYGSLNGGLGSNDDTGHVIENRRRMAEQLGVAATDFMTLYQIHSPDVAVVTERWDAETRPRADAMVTKIPGLALGVTAADCGPILFADPEARIIGAAHAGWKGAFGGVLESTLDAMVKLGASRDKIMVAIGPLIRQRSYEVGAEFVARLVQADAANEAFFIPSQRDGHRLFDLAGYIRARFGRAGVLTIDDVDTDTYSDDRFFSYRRSVHRREPDYGRNIHALVLAE